MPLSWFARAVRWVTANPLFGLIGLLLASLGIARMRASHLENRAAKAQRDADLARLKLKREAAAGSDTAQDAKQAAVSTATAAARKKEQRAAAKAADAAASLKEIGKRWPTK